MNLTKYRHITFVLATGGLFTLVMILLVAQPGRAAGPWYVTPGGDDGNDCLSPGAPCATINGAIGKASSGDTIYVADGTYTGTGYAVVLLNKDVHVSGGWDDTFTTQSGTSTIDGEISRRGISVYSGVNGVVERLTVRNGSITGFGGGIANGGTLTLNNCAVSGNSAGRYSGGGISNGGTLILNHSTVSGNTAGITGGGISNDGTLTLTNSTVSGNTGGGISNGSAANLMLNSSTVSDNTGGGINNDGTATLQSSILAGNTDGNSPDCSGSIGSLGYNLVGDTSGCAFTPGTGDLTNVNADLSPLIGSPAYHPLSSGSPAIDAVPLDQCSVATDQRGVTRPQGLACDIGAYEYTTPGPPHRVYALGGSPQHAPPFFAFPTLLQAAVLDSIGSPVSNSLVIFSAPSSGASGTFADSGTATTTAVTDDSGIATASTFTANGLIGSYEVTATVSGVVTPARFLLGNLGWYVAPEGDDSNDCETPTTPCATITGPLEKAGFLAGDTVLAATGIYTGTSAAVVLLDRDAVLSGGWDDTFTTQSGTSTIDGEGSHGGIKVNIGVTAIVERFIVQNGSKYTTYGWLSGIANGGTLTLNNCTVSGNSAGPYSGGGIGNGGTLTLNDSTVSGNTAGRYGGGIYNGGGTVTLDSSNVTGNTAVSGGIDNDGGTMTLNSSTVSGNTGIGVKNDNGTMALTNSTVDGNTGRGISNSSGTTNESGIMTLANSTVSANANSGILNSGTMTLTNSTISGNTTGGDGGGIRNTGTLSLTNSTVSVNMANGDGGGIDNNGGTVILQQSILAGNLAGGPPDCSGAIDSSGYNLVGDTSGCAFTPGTGDLTNVNPKLGQLIGTPGYHPLLSGSPAIDAIPLAGCTGATDQRGVARPQGPGCDMGAYEYTPPGPAASILAIGGTPQTTPPSFPFWLPLQALVLDGIGTPTDAVTVKFSAPASGASGTFADSGTYTTTAQTNELGIVTAATFTANGLEGSYSVTATVSGVITPANFLLSNLRWYVAPGGDDNNDCLTPATPCATINGPLGKASFLAGDAVFVASGTYTGAGGEVVLLDKSIRLLGGWDSTFAMQSGISIIDGEGARQGLGVTIGVTAVLERFTVQRGNGGGIVTDGTLTLDHCTVIGNSGSGINNAGTLILDNSTVSGNTGEDRGGINNAGSLTLNNSAVSGNNGRGIYNEGTLTLNNCTVSSNAGGGIHNGGTLTLNSSAVTGNTVHQLGAGIVNDEDAHLTLNNCTVSGNATTDERTAGGGIYTRGSTVTLNNSTVSGNTANGEGGGIYRWRGAVILQNTILAGNVASGSGPDCSGAIGSGGYNLIGNVSGCAFTPGTGDLTDMGAKLGPLEGSPGYHPLLVGSPAINSGNPGGCTDHLGNPLTTDQRGFPRLGTCDIGAYEVPPLAFSAKVVNRSGALAGDPIAYTIALSNVETVNISDVQVSDTLPITITYIEDSLTATAGSYGYSTGVVTWTGSVSADAVVTITFDAAVNETAPLGASIANSAIISGAGEIITRTAAVKVVTRVYLPLLLRNAP